LKETGLARFFFNIHYAETWIEDEDGLDLDDLQAAQIEAESVLRELVAMSILQPGRQCPARVQITGGGTGEVGSVKLRAILPPNIVALLPPE
jgi:hypothetical protein